MSDMEYGAVLKLRQPEASPSMFKVHGALIFAYVLFGGGAFASKFGVHGGSPCYFEMIREAIAGPIMSVAATTLGAPVFPQLRDLNRTVVVCLLFVGNQIFFMLGLKLTEPIFAAAWQIAIPIITIIIAVLAGFESITTMKALGTTLACSGAMMMNVLHFRMTQHDNCDASSYVLLGHACFLLQAASCSGYIICGKALVDKYPPLAVTGWSFTLGSLVMLVVTYVGYTVPAINDVMCWSTNLESMAMCKSIRWELPVGMIAPLLYEIVACSFLGWVLITWANRYANASTVAIYSVTQPLASAVVSAVAIMIKGGAWAKVYAIQMPGSHHLLGVLVISFGLFVVYRDNVTKPSSERKAFTKQMVP